jgi:transcriptional regulator of nitric oxide reductase
VSACGATAVSAQSIFVNPKPESHFTHVFPGAVYVSPKSGQPPHFTVYRADPKTAPTAQPIGYIFWTAELVPGEYGYHGPVHVLVGLDVTGVITGVVVDYHSEPYGYFSVELPQFAAQFVGKSVRDAFRVGGDVDAVSRATLSITSATRAIRDSSRLMAKQFLSPDAVKK